MRVCAHEYKWWTSGADLQEVVSCLILVPGTELGSPGGTVCVVNHWAISPASQEVVSPFQLHRSKIKTLLTNSTPITPAPITTNFSGTFFKDKAPVDDTIVSSSIYKKSKSNK